MHLLDDGTVNVDRRFSSLAFATIAVFPGISATPKLERNNSMTFQTPAIIFALAAAAMFPQIGYAAGGGATPEAAFDNLKSAMSNKDYKTGFAQMTPNTQDVILGGMVMAMSSRLGLDPAKASEAQKIVERYGIKKMDPTKTQPNQGPQTMLQQTVANVKDKPACFAEMMAWMENTPPTKSEKNVDVKSQGGTASVIALIRRFPATLVDVKTQGDTARGTIKMKFGNQETSGPMAFKKVGGMWYIDMTVPPAEAGNGPPGQPKGSAGN